MAMPSSEQRSTACLALVRPPNLLILMLTNDHVGRPVPGHGHQAEHVVHHLVEDEREAGGAADYQTLLEEIVQNEN